MKNIILLHGALGASEDLNLLEKDLAAKGLKTHAFSFSGHGNTPFTSNFGIAHFAEELKEFIEKKSLNAVTIFGYSMGGFVALQLASQKNSSIEKVITLGTKFNWSKESVEKEIQLLDPETILKKVPAFAAVLEKKHGKTWKELVLKTAALMVEISDKQFLKPEVLGAIHVPVLLGIADRDTMVSLDETVSVFKTLPNAQMFMLPHSKHPLESVNIALLSEHIAYFLNS